MEYLLVILLLGVIGLLFFVLWRQNTLLSSEKLTPVVQQLLGASAGIVSQQTQALLQSERSAIHTDLATRQQHFERLVLQVQQDMAQRQQEIRTLEQDRALKFAQLSEALQQQRSATDALQVSTTRLNQVLNSNQTRGEWGERILEDLLRSNGLVEGVHYLRQYSIPNTALRPDVALLLPERNIVAVDVKFPYQAMQRWSQAGTAEEKKLARAQFEQDVKAKIKKVAEYIVPEQGTLEYSLVFVPNELIFSLINQEFPHLVDDALARRVLLVSPFTFLVVARTVMESYRNFRLSDTLREVSAHVTVFLKEWEKFSQSLLTYGKSLEKLQRDYTELTGTRTRQLEKAISKINETRDGLPEKSEL